MTKLAVALVLAVSCAWSARAQEGALSQLSALAGRESLVAPRAAALKEDERAGVEVRLFDGRRQPLAPGTQVLLRAFDGDGRERFSGFVDGSEARIDGLPVADNFRDAYSIIAWAPGARQAGFFPVRLSAGKTPRVDLMLMPKDNRFDFSAARWDLLRLSDPLLWALLSHGEDAGAARLRYEGLMGGRPESLACLLNIATALSGIMLPGGAPISYFKDLIWDDTMKKDRFFAWVDPAIIGQIRQAAKSGGFAPERGAGLLHPGATLSYKQTDFGEGDVQFTFHENDRKVIDGVDCVMVEMDIDLYADDLSHIFLEVIPHLGRRGFTDPRDVYLLRWMAGRQAGAPEFNPPYAIVPAQ